MQNGSFDLISKPKLLSPWRLRNDIKNLVVYTCTTNETKHRVLSPCEASIMPFFNGLNTLEEIYRFWCEIHGSKKKNLLESFNKIVSVWFENGIVGVNGETSPSMENDPNSMIPRFRSYQFPVSRLQRPIGVLITPTNNCNTNCLYCYAERNRCSELTFEKWVSIFDELAENEIYVVDISGGDLFARNDCMGILRNMTKRNFVFFLSTKSYISEKTAVELREMGIGCNDVLPHLVRPMQFSIDAAESKVAALLCGTENYLDRAVTSVKNMIKAGMTPRVKSVITSYNCEAPEDVVKLFSDMGVDQFQFVQYGRSYYRHDDSLFLSGDQKKQFIETMVKLRQDYPHVSITAQEDASILPSASMTVENWHSRSLCSGGRINMKIQPNGDVTLCDQMPHTKDFIVGNVFEQGVMGVWNSQKLSDFLNAPRKLFTGTRCFECSEFDECHYKLGYCYRDSLFNFGTIYDAPPNCPYQTKVGLRAV